MQTASKVSENLYTTKNTIANGIVFKAKVKKLSLLYHTFSNQTPTITVSTSRNTSAYA